ncbi:hypothetical protein GGP41_009310 [Bipolaris sorokiniana]|uniref:PSI domain-containing protein n=1 Tax=Cochliobolus sativus TaxID=45130 RepID=A0A8H5ZD54_COCSA|nr:hypothetical protein GGP41_009310 [Bipolaris sorokiniana]
MNLTFPVIFSSLFLSTSAICCLFNPQPSGCPFTCKKVKTNCKCCYGPELSTSRNQCKNDYRDWCLSYEDPPGVTGACHMAFGCAYINGSLDHTTKGNRFVVARTRKKRLREYANFTSSAVVLRAASSPTVLPIRSHAQVFFINLCGFLLKGNMLSEVFF